MVDHGRSPLQMTKSLDSAVLMTEHGLLTFRSPLNAMSQEVLTPSSLLLAMGGGKGVGVLFTGLLTEHGLLTIRSSLKRREMNTARLASITMAPSVRLGLASSRFLCLIKPAFCRPDCVLQPGNLAPSFGRVPNPPKSCAVSRIGPTKNACSCRRF